jgi:putative heme-binding domain-containing protein
VVPVDQQMTVVSLKDGRVLSGVIAGQTERTLTLRLLNQEQTVERQEIAKQQTAGVSMMPEGLLNALTREQVRDLLAYLMHPTQVPLPASSAKAP